MTFSFRVSAALSARLRQSILFSCRRSPWCSSSAEPPASLQGRKCWGAGCHVGSCRCRAFRLGRTGPEPVCPAQEQEAGVLTLGGSVLLRSCPPCSAVSWPQVEDGQYVQSLQKKLEPIFACKEVELQSNASTEEPMVGHIPSEDTSEGDESPKEGNSHPYSHPRFRTVAIFQ